MHLYVIRLLDSLERMPWMARLPAALLAAGRVQASCV